MPELFCFLQIKRKVDNQRVGSRAMTEVLATVVGETVLFLLLRGGAEIRRHVHAVGPGTGCYFGECAFGVHLVSSGRKAFGVERGGSPSVVLNPAASVGGMSCKENGGSRLNTNGVYLGLRALRQSVVIRHRGADKWCRRDGLLGVDTVLRGVEEHGMHLAVAAAEVGICLIMMIEWRLTG